MTTKGKFKKKFRTRLAPTKEQRSYIDRVSNPASPADLLLALQDPSTPAYKEMMNLIAAREQNQAVIAKLVEQFLIETYQASQREKEEIFKGMLAKEHAEQKELRPQYNLQAELPAKSLFVNEEKLKETIETRFYMIEGLKKEVNTLNEQLKQLDTKANELSKAWEKTIEHQRDTMLKNLEQDKVPILSSSGKVIDTNDARYQTLLNLPAPDPVKIVSMVSASYELHQTKLAAEEQENKNEGIKNKAEEIKKEGMPPAPPKPPRAPPDFLKHPKNMAQKGCVMEQLSFLAALRDDKDSPHEMLKVLANNKALGSYFPGAQQSAKAAVKALDELENIHKKEPDLPADPNLKERTDFFEKASDLYAQKKSTQDALLTKVTELSKQEMLQAIDQKALKELNNQENVTADKESPAVKHH